MTIAVVISSAPRVSGSTSGLAAAMIMPFSTERFAAGKPQTAHGWRMTSGHLPLKMLFQFGGDSRFRF